MRIAIIGSGLSALACAHALIRRGLKPVVIDAGQSLEPHKQAIVDRMAQQLPGEWQDRDLEAISDNPSLARGGVPKKLVFGSDYIYANDETQITNASDRTAAVTTLAKGGYSNAWGATILPAAQCDLEGDWPFSLERLAPHYAQVMKWLPLSSGTDQLETQFPAYGVADGQITPPPLIAKMIAQAQHQPDAAYVAGQARLAVTTSGSNACRYCGQCMAGCVYGSIFSSADEMDALHQSGRIQYLPGTIVTQLAEVGNTVQVRSRQTAGARSSMEFDRVIVCAGAIASTRLILRSLGLFDHPVTFQDSLKFLMPAFHLTGAQFQHDEQNSLSAMFIETRVPALADNWMHMQITTANEFIMRGIGTPPGSIRARLASPVLNRLTMAWCSLHSNHSAKLSGVLQGAEDDDRFVFSVMEPETSRQSLRLAKKAASHAMRKAGAIAIPQLGRLSSPGAGNHTGGSLPMQAHRQTPTATDLLGRPGQYQRIHVADSAVMPTIPATTIAFTMMANADRIASEAPLS